MTDQQLYNAIRDIPDFPKPGIVFKDITPILLDPALFREVVRRFSDTARAAGAEKIAGIDARGFLFGATVAYELGVGFVPIRKRGKLPYETASQKYDLEYGSAEIEIHTDAFLKGEKVAVIDDLLATGGTAGASLKLIEESGAHVVSVQFLIELAFLDGRRQLSSPAVSSILVYS